MSLTISTRTYNIDSYINSNAVAYAGPAQTSFTRDSVRLTRKAAKANATYSGNVRLDFKIEKTLTLTGALTPTGNIVGNNSVQVPVGASDAAIDAFCDDQASFWSSAAGKNFVKKSLIAQ